MRIIHFLDWEPNHEQVMTNQDGLMAATAELRNRGHDVTFVTVGKDAILENPLHEIHMTSTPVELISGLKPDVILHHADFTRPNAKPLKDLGIPMALCFAGGEVDTYNTFDFEHVFVESQVYADKLEELGVPHSIAFGTNTDLFKPIEAQPKVFDTIFPATFAAWKRHSLYAQAVQGMKALACGYMYDNHEQECWEECLRLGTVVLPHASANVLHYLYAASKVCVIPSMSSGGSQRTVLEAMAMNLPLVVTDSDKFDYLTDECFRVEPEAEAIRGAVLALLDGDRTVNTREHVLNNWSQIQYADALEKGLQAIL